MNLETLTNRGFKLISLRLKDNTLFGKSEIFYEFIDAKDTFESIYTTVIIGPNGTGKSNLFRVIIELFKELEDLKKGKGRSYNIDGKFDLKYYIDNDFYEFSNFMGNLTFLSKHGNPVHLTINGVRAGLEKAILPTAIVANSIMLTDKYPFYKKDVNNRGKKIDSFPQYKYLGVRNIAQNASTRAYIRRTVEFIVKQFNSTEFISGLQKAINFLELSDTINIYYTTSNTSKFFKGSLTPEVIKEYFDKIKNKYPKTDDNPPYKLNHYLQIRDNKGLIQDICTFCNNLKFDIPPPRFDKPIGLNRKILYNLLDKNSFTELNKGFYILEHLRQLGMISPPEIELKRTDGYSLQESSSGEYHFFSSIVGLMAVVKSNSLVFIDEPEISLHPNWQMKYLTFIRELFSDPDYFTSHILIATHSHFLISDLTSNSSKIIGLSRINGKTEIVKLPPNINTFGWSAEQILLEVFKVPTTRNYYIAEKVGDILELISQPQRDEFTIKEKVKELIDSNVIALSSEDPLKTVINRLIKKYE